MITEYLDASGANMGQAIAQAVALLFKGELVAFPTETVYGLGADAFNPIAITNVFRAKGRPADNPLIVHVADIEAIEKCGHVDERVERLSQAYMPGPLTVVVRAKEIVPSIARAGLPTVALRIPDHPVALDLLRQAGPLVAPSANLSGRPSPTRAEHVRDDLDGRIAAILDGGPCTIGIESTVLDLSGPSTVVLRPGSISAEELSEVLKEPVTGFAENKGGLAQSPQAPGMKYRHYAPRIPVQLVIADTPPDLSQEKEPLVVLTTARHRDIFPHSVVFLLSETTLYDTFRRAEEGEFCRIVIYALPGELPEGILNRVQKAASDS